MVGFAGGLLSSIGRAGAGGFKAYGEAAQDKIDAAKEAAIAKRQATRDKILAGYGMEQAKFAAGARATEAEKGREFTAGQGLLEREARSEEAEKGREFTRERDRLKRENDLEIARLKASGEDPETKKLKLQVLEGTQKMIEEGASLPQVNEYRAQVGLAPLGAELTGEVLEEGGFLGFGETKTPVSELRPQEHIGEISGGTSAELSQALESLGAPSEQAALPNGVSVAQEVPPASPQADEVEQQIEINPALPEDLKQWNVQDLQDDSGKFQHMAFTPGRREPIILTEEEYQYWIKNRAPKREPQEPWRGGLLSPYMQ